MNYIKLINHFWQLRREREDFDPYVISLYFALVNMANLNSWECFSTYREDITALAGMSPSAYYRAREILKDAGLIQYEAGANKLSKCTFTVCSLYATNTVDDTQHTHNKDGKQHTPQTENDTILDKPVNKKTTKPKNHKTSSLHQSAIAAFESFYFSKFATKYIFNGGKDGTAIKNLLEKVKKKTAESGIEETEENILQGFTLLLQSITDTWVLDNLTPALLNSKFNELFKNAKNGASKQQPTESRIEPYIELLRERGHI